MSTDERARLIAAIIAHMGFHSREQKKAFDAGDAFFALAFKSDAELQRIAHLTGC